MNAPVKMGLLQREGFTVLKRGVVEKDAGNGGGKRTGLDDDPSRWDEPGALLFMSLQQNNRVDFPYYGDAPEKEKHKDALHRRGRNAKMRYARKPPFGPASALVANSTMNVCGIGTWATPTTQKSG